MFNNSQWSRRLPENRGAEFQVLSFLASHLGSLGAGKRGWLGRFPPAAFLSLSAAFFLCASERRSLPAGKVQPEKEMSICGISSAFLHLHSGGSEGFLMSSKLMALYQCSLSLSIRLLKVVASSGSVPFLTNSPESAPRRKPPAHSALSPTGCY